jgi:hypothetical protein
MVTFAQRGIPEGKIFYANKVKASCCSDFFGALLLDFVWLSVVSDFASRCCYQGIGLKLIFSCFVG